MIDKIRVFQDELQEIRTPEIKFFAEEAIKKMPDYFFEVAASSTGKYHPAYSLGSGGLVRHTKAAVKIAIDLLNREYYQGHFNDEIRDCIIVALILHDSWKHGTDGSAYTVAKHPTIAADWVISDTFEGLDDCRYLISKLISSHMGEWNTDYRSKKEILPKPKDEPTMFVHMCDYLASRKWLTVEFDEYYAPSAVKYQLESDSPSLDDLKTKIVALCKKKIDGGTSRDLILDTIAELNDGRKNPMSITNIEIANKVYKEVESL